MQGVSSLHPEERSVFISSQTSLAVSPVYSLTYHNAPQLSTLHQTSHKNTQVCFCGSSFPDDGSHVTQNANTSVCFLPVNLSLSVEFSDSTRNPKKTEENLFLPYSGFLTSE